MCILYSCTETMSAIGSEIAHVLIAIGPQKQTLTEFEIVLYFAFIDGATFVVQMRVFDRLAQSARRRVAWLFFQQHLPCCVKLRQTLLERQLFAFVADLMRVWQRLQTACRTAIAVFGHIYKFKIEFNPLLLLLLTYYYYFSCMQPANLKQNSKSSLINKSNTIMSRDVCLQN